MRALLVILGLGAVGCLPAQDGGEGPIVAAERHWTFISFPEAKCANGTSTGIGVNLAPQSDEVVLYLQGGGACASGPECFGPFPGAVNISTGYGPDQFRAEGNLSGIVFLDRLAVDNPLRDANLVFVPYCTGDLHAGDAAVTYEVDGAPRVAEHRGGANLRAFLERIVLTFPNARRVYLLGASAGGFGALFNAHRVRAALEGVRVDVLSDSGPPIPVPEALTTAWREKWNLQLPSDCEGCAQSPERILEHASAAQPQSNIALLGSMEDGILAHYAGLDGGQMAERMVQLRTRVEALPNVEAFVVPGAGHVVIANRLAWSDGVSLSDWLAGFAAENVQWRSAWP